MLMKFLSSGIVEKLSRLKNNTEKPEFCKFVALGVQDVENVASPQPAKAESTPSSPK